MCSGGRTAVLVALALVAVWWWVPTGPYVTPLPLHYETDILEAKIAQLRLANERREASSGSDVVQRARAVPDLRFPLEDLRESGALREFHGTLSTEDRAVQLRDCACPDCSTPSALCSAPASWKCPVVPSFKHRHLLSTHHCHSRPFVDGHHRHATCKFRNLHAVPRGHLRRIRWVYVAADECRKTRLLHSDEFNLTLGVGAHAFAPALEWRPDVMTPEEFLAWFGNPEHRTSSATHVMFHEFNHENFGHVISDTMMPLFSAAASFGVDVGDIQALKFLPEGPLIGWACDFQVQHFAEQNQHEKSARIAKACSRLEKTLMPLLSRRPLITTSDLYRQVPEGTVLSMTLIAGIATLSDDCPGGDGTHGRHMRFSDYCLHGRQRQLLEFRRHTLRMAGVTLPPVTPPLRVVITGAGTDKHRILDAGELYKMITEQLAGVQVDVVRWEALGSLNAQLQVIGSTAVHVTAPGGSSFIGLWLPAGATQIRAYLEMESFGQEWHFFSHLPHVHVEYMPAQNGRIPQLEQMLRVVKDGLDRFENLS